MSALLQSHREHYQKMKRGGRCIDTDQLASCGHRMMWCHSKAPIELHLYLMQFSPEDRAYILNGEQMPKVPGEQAPIPSLSSLTKEEQDAFAEAMRDELSKM